MVNNVFVHFERREEILFLLKTWHACFVRIREPGMWPKRCSTDVLLFYSNLSRKCFPPPSSAAVRACGRAVSASVNILPIVMIPRTSAFWHLLRIIHQATLTISLRLSLVRTCRRKEMHWQRRKQRSQTLSSAVDTNESAAFSYSSSTF